MMRIIKTFVSCATYSENFDPLVSLDLFKQVPPNQPRRERKETATSDLAYVFGISGNLRPIWAKSATDFDNIILRLHPFLCPVI